MAKARMRDTNKSNPRVKRGLLPLLNSREEDSYREVKEKVMVFEPLNSKQGDYWNSIQQNILTYAIGPAGTGKTFVAAAAIGEWLNEDRRNKVIVTRPAVEAGESLGFLPGDLSEKYTPYMTPLLQALEKLVGKGHVEGMIKAGRIEMLPLALMRGRSFERTFALLDEAQNATPSQMKMFLTRIGDNCKVIIDGDPTQKDIPGPSGLLDSVYKIRHLKSVRVIKFTREDIVRSGLVQEIVECYEDAHEKAREEEELELAA